MAAVVRSRPGGGEWQTFVIVVLLAALSGAAVLMHPLAPIALLAVAVGLILVAQGERTVTLALGALGALLIGYAFLGRGLAYLGVSPAYVGELVLVMSVLAVAATMPWRRLGFVDVLIVAFMGWGALRTFPYLQTYGVDALRDAVTWGYALFALILSLVVRAHHLRTIVKWYGAALPFLVVWIPLLAIVWYQFGGLLPTIPGTNVRIPFYKAGDMAVHLAGIAAFLIGGLYQQGAWRRVSEPVIWVAWLVGVAIASAVNRGGMLAVGVTTTMVVLVVRSIDRWIPVLVMSLLVVAVALAVDVEVEAERGRSISIGQLIDNAQSVITDSDRAELSGTREWREAWWNDVVDYTVHGPYFWDGKGFGINLAREDGFAGETSSLRAPHNAHLQFLARAGIPGLVGWTALQLAFVYVIATSALRASRRGQHYWFGVHVWIFAYWLAALVNMSFDVYLEGPQGGIVFWSIFGAGLALSKLTADDDRRRPRAAARKSIAPAPGSRRTEPAWLAECQAHHVDINTADVATLSRIRHIGPGRARQIVQLRPFSSVNELSRVRGISPSRLAEIRSQRLVCDRLVRYGLGRLRVRPRDPIPPAPAGTLAT